MKQQQRLMATMRRATAVLCAALLAPALAHAQTDHWPTKPLHLVVGYAAGSSPDVQARLLAEPLSQLLGQPVVVENKGGASGNIGADAVAKARDGHTIGVIGNGPLTSSKFLYPHLPYDPVKDLAPLAMIGSAPLVLVAPRSLVTQDAAAYLQSLKQRKDGNYASVGTGSGGHLGMELVQQALGLDLQHVPYNGGPAVINGLLGGQVQLALLPTSTVMPLVESGKLAALAVSVSQRSPLAPGVPAMPEIGAGQLDIEVWNAVMAPASMPEAHRNQLAQALQQVLQSEGVRAKLTAQGWHMDDTSAQALARRMTQDARINGELIARKNIRLQ